MAKKVSKKFNVVIELNPEKAGAWMASVSVSTLYDAINPRITNTLGDEAVDLSAVTAWKNSSAAKRWVKSKVQEMTPRKSVKLLPSKFDLVTHKPIAFTGVLEFKA